MLTLKVVVGSVFFIIVKRQQFYSALNNTPNTRNTFNTLSMHPSSAALTQSNVALHGKNSLISLDFEVVGAIFCRTANTATLTRIDVLQDWLRNRAT